MMPARELSQSTVVIAARVIGGAFSRYKVLQEKRRPVWVTTLGFRSWQLEVVSWQRAVGSLPTPVVTEEEAEGGINTTNIEEGHCNIDQIAHRHREGGYYASIDGSTHWFKEPRNCDFWCWFSKVPSGKMQSFGHVPNPTWRRWDRQ